MNDSPFEAEAEEFSPDDEESVEHVAPFRIILTASIVTDDLACLPGESPEHARNDATLAICQAFHHALHLVNEEEGTAFNVFDFRIETAFPWKITLPGDAEDPDDDR